LKSISETATICKSISETATICKNIFKSGNETTSKTQFTKKWIEMINKIEKGKG
jgi:hypothetical protein